jgi:Cupin
MDPRGEALHFLRMSCVFYCRSEFTAPWALALEPFKARMMFHVVTAGQCWLEVRGRAYLPHRRFANVPEESSFAALGITKRS